MKKGEENDENKEKLFIDNKSKSYDDIIIEG